MTNLINEVSEEIVLAYQRKYGKNPESYLHQHQIRAYIHYKLHYNNIRDTQGTVVSGISLLSTMANAPFHLVQLQSHQDDHAFQAWIHSLDDYQSEIIAEII